MPSKLRIKGRILILGNVTLLTLTLATTVLLILCANFSVLIYEMVVAQKLSVYFAEYEKLVNFLVALLFLFFTFSVYSRIKLGTDRFFLRRAQKKGASAKDIFYYFHPMRTVGAVTFSLKMLLLKAFFLFLSLFPFTLSAVMLYILLKNDVSALVALSLLCGCVAFLICGIVFYKKMTSSFFLAKYYFIEGKFISFSHLISSSQEDMKKQRKILLRLRSGFIGWFLLCLLIVPIGYVWSYYNQTMAIAGESFMTDNI